MKPRPVHLDVEHCRTGAKAKVEFVEVLAKGKRAPRARAVVCRWVGPAGSRTLFCSASGWELGAGAQWRLSAASRKRARQLAQHEGLELPQPRGFPPPSLRAPDAAAPMPRRDERQTALPFEAELLGGGRK